MNNLTVGQVVISKQGRDKGSYYVVFNKVNECYLLVDGNKRTFQNPKRKNVKHIQPTAISSGSIGDLISSDSMPLDSEVKKFIKDLTDKELRR